MDIEIIENFTNDLSTVITSHNEVKRFINLIQLEEADFFLADLQSYFDMESELKKLVDDYYLFRKKLIVNLLDFGFIRLQHSSLSGRKLVKLKKRSWSK